MAGNGEYRALRRGFLYISSLPASCTRRIAPIVKVPRTAAAFGRPCSSAGCNCHAYVSFGTSGKAYAVTAPASVACTTGFLGSCFVVTIRMMLEGPSPAVYSHRSLAAKQVLKSSPFAGEVIFTRSFEGPRHGTGGEADARFVPFAGTQ